MCADTQEKQEKPSAKWRDQMPAAIVGVLGTIAGCAIALLSAGHVESNRVREMRRSEAIKAYVLYSWSKKQDDASQLEFARALSQLSVYAPKSLLDAVRKYNQIPEKDKVEGTDESNQAWAEVVAEMRRAVGVEDVPQEEIAEILYGK